MALDDGLARWFRTIGSFALRVAFSPPPSEAEQAEAAKASKSVMLPGSGTLATRNPTSAASNVGRSAKRYEDARRKEDSPQSPPRTPREIPPIVPSFH